MKDFFSNKRNIVICCIVLGVVVLVAIGLLIYNVFFGSEKNVQKNLEIELKEMGKDFYENFYYDLVVKDHGKDQISKFKDVGIKVDLNNLGRYKSENDERVKKFVNPKNNEECSKEDTKVVIYPEDPFEKNNYRMETILSCGFEESK